MTRPVVWSDPALADLLSISRYIAADNPDAAAAVARRLRTTADHLGELATGRVGRVSGTYEKLAPGLPYIIAYEIAARPEGELIAILHVIHARRNWPAEEWPEDYRRLATGETEADPFAG